MGPLLSSVHSLSPLISLSFYYHFTSGAAEAQGPDVADQTLPGDPLKNGGDREQLLSSHPPLFPLEDGRQEEKASWTACRGTARPLPGGEVVAGEHQT